MKQSPNIQSRLEQKMFVLFCLQIRWKQGVYETHKAFESNLMFYSILFPEIYKKIKDILPSSLPIVDIGYFTDIPDGGFK